MNGSMNCTTYAACPVAIGALSSLRHVSRVRTLRISKRAARHVLITSAQNPDGEKAKVAVPQLATQEKADMKAKSEEARMTILHCKPAVPAPRAPQWAGLVGWALGGLAVATLLQKAVTNMTKKTPAPAARPIAPQAAVTNKAAVRAVTAVREETVSSIPVPAMEDPIVEPILPDPSKYAFQDQRPDMLKTVSSIPLPAMEDPIVEPILSDPSRYAFRGQKPDVLKTVSNRAAEEAEEQVTVDEEEEQEETMSSIPLPAMEDPMGELMLPDPSAEDERPDMPKTAAVTNKAAVEEETVSSIPLPVMEDPIAEPILPDPSKYAEDKWPDMLETYAVGMKGLRGDVLVSTCNVLNLTGPMLVQLLPRLRLTEDELANVLPKFQLSQPEWLALGLEVVDQTKSKATIAQAKAAALSAEASAKTAAGAHAIAEAKAALEAKAKLKGEAMAKIVADKNAKAEDNLVVQAQDKAKALALSLGVQMSADMLVKAKAQAKAAADLSETDAKAAALLEANKKTVSDAKAKAKMQEEVKTAASLASKTQAAVQAQAQAAAQANASDEAAKASADAVKASDEAAKASAEVMKLSADEATKAAEEKAIMAEKERVTAEAKARSAAEEKERAAALAKSAKEAEAKASDEAAKASDEAAKALAAAMKASAEEAMKVAQEKAKSAENERVREANAKMKAEAAAEAEAQSAAEEKERADAHAKSAEEAEEKALDEAAKASAEATKAAEEKAKAALTLNPKPKMSAEEKAAAAAQRRKAAAEVEARNAAEQKERAAALAKSAKEAEAKTNMQKKSSAEMEVLAKAKAIVEVKAKKEVEANMQTLATQVKGLRQSDMLRELSSKELSDAQIVALTPLLGLSSSGVRNLVTSMGLDYMRVVELVPQLLLSSGDAVAMMTAALSDCPVSDLATFIQTIMEKAPELDIAEIVRALGLPVSVLMPALLKLNLRAAQLGDLVNGLKLSREALMVLVPDLGLSPPGLVILVPKLQSLPAKDKAVLLSQHNDADVAQLSDAELAKLVPQLGLSKEESEALIVDMSLSVADWASTLTALHLAGMDVAGMLPQLKGLTVADTAALIGKLRPILTPSQFAEEVLPKLKLTKAEKVLLVKSMNVSATTLALVLPTLKLSQQTLAAFILNLNPPVPATDLAMLLNKLTRAKALDVEQMKALLMKMDFSPETVNVLVPSLNLSPSQAGSLPADLKAAAAARGKDAESAKSKSQSAEAESAAQSAAGVRDVEYDMGRNFSKGQLVGEELLTLPSMNLTNTQLVQVLKQLETPAEDLPPLLNVLDLGGGAVGKMLNELDLSDNQLTMVLSALNDPATGTLDRKSLMVALGALTQPVSRLVRVVKGLNLSPTEVGTVIAGARLGQKELQLVFAGLKYTKAQEYCQLFRAMNTLNELELATVVAAAQIPTDQLGSIFTEFRMTPKGMATIVAITAVMDPLTTESYMRKMVIKLDLSADDLRKVAQRLSLSAAGFPKVKKLQEGMTAQRIVRAQMVLGFPGPMSERLVTLEEIGLTNAEVALALESELLAEDGVKVSPAELAVALSKLVSEADLPSVGAALVGRVGLSQDDAAKVWEELKLSGENAETFRVKVGMTTASASTPPQPKETGTIKKTREPKVKEVKESKSFLEGLLKDFVKPK